MISDKAIPRDSLLLTLSDPWPDDSLRKWIAEQRKSTNHCVVALDDDPTGTQTVHGVSVVTRWQIEDLKRALASNEPALYVLTNSRSMSLNQAQSLNREIAANLIKAADAVGRPISVVSRSDSTLRGHYPGEVEALQAAFVESTGQAFDGVCIIPFFKEGGRYTINDIHFVEIEDRLIPAAHTPYAKDAVFGYAHSSLPKWVEEKTGGEIPAADVLTISLETIRKGGPDAVARQLREICYGRVVVVNAACDRDLEVFVRGLLTVEAEEKRFLFRTAASFVKVSAGLEERPLLSRLEVVGERPSSGGLIVFGSYVERSTAQLQRALQLDRLLPVEIHVPSVLDPGKRKDLIDQSAEQINQALSNAQDVILYTSREIITARDEKDNLAIGRSISSALVEIVQQVDKEPRFLISKGGITSSDIATEGLQVSIAHVLGQIIDGVAVWKLGSGSRWPGVPYVVFPGNVGGPEAVAEVIGSLRV